MRRSLRYGISSRCCTASSASSGSGSSQPTEPGWPRCSAGSPSRRCGTCGWWCGPTRSCVGTVTYMPAATRRRRGPGGGDGQAPYVRSAPWCCASWRRTRRGDTGGCTGNCSPSGSRSPHPRSGRSCARPGSIPPGAGRHDLGAVPAFAGRGAAGRGLHRNDHTHRHEDVCPRGRRTRQPSYPDPRRHRTSHRRLGDPDRPQPGDGPGGRGMPGEVSDPRPGRCRPRRDTQPFSAASVTGSPASTALTGPDAAAPRSTLPEPLRAPVRTRQGHDVPGQMRSGPTESSSCVHTARRRLMTPAAAEEAERPPRRRRWSGLRGGS
jgi:hypothetical protein